MAQSRSVSRKRRRKAGRPSRLLPETKKRILSAIRAGVPAKTACIGSGVGESTFYDWIRRGEDPNAPKQYREFVSELAEARQAGQIQRIAIIQKAANQDWRAAAWLAERIDPANFCQRFQIEHGGEVKVNLFAPVHIPDEDAAWTREPERVTVDVPPPPD